jgi:UDP-2,3-diacylglucosamine pyrophosphatase LpxH
MTLHDELLFALRSVASVSLVASYRDPRLQFAAADDLRVFVPDLHLLSNERRLRYRYGTNQTGLLADALRAITQVKARDPNRTVVNYQIGDFLDLWRETPVESDRLDAASKIQDSHPDLVRTILSADLKTRFLLGNHDFELHRWTNYTAWERRYYMAPRGNFKPTAVALHGDVFDWVEMLPEPLNRFFVYFFSPFHSATDYDLGEIQQLIINKNSALDFTSQIAGTADVGALQNPSDGVPDRHNVRIATTGSQADDAHEFLEIARETCQRANTEFNLGLRLAVIGHTHHARIAVWDPGGDAAFFVLVDTGAWIEQCQTATGLQPNAQITALSGNEVRIYQLAPRS